MIGKYGNPYEDYVAAFDLPLPNDGLNLIPVTGNVAISAPVPSDFGSSMPASMTLVSQGQQSSQADGGFQQTGFQHQRRTSAVAKQIQSGQGRNTNGISQSQADEESFFDILKTVASAIPAGLGLIGGGPIGALAGFAASAIAAESAGAESSSDGSIIPEGSLERAILAEAALGALQSGDLHPDLEESIFRDMRDAVISALPTVRKAAPRVMGAMMEPALRIALDSLSKYNQRVASGAEGLEDAPSEPFKPTTQYSAAIDQPIDRQTEAFLRHLQASLRGGLQESALAGGSEEGFFDDVLKGATRVGSGVLTAVKHGLPIIADVAKHLSGAEAFEDQQASGVDTQLLTANALAQRALVADAALKVVMKVPVH